MVQRSTFSANSTVSKRINDKLPPRSDKVTVEASVGAWQEAVCGEWPYFYFGREVAHPTQLPMPRCSGITLPHDHSEALETDGLGLDRHTVLWSPVVLKCLLLFWWDLPQGRQVEVEDGDASLGVSSYPGHPLGNSRVDLAWKGVL